MAASTRALRISAPQWVIVLLVAACFAALASGARTPAIITTSGSSGGGIVALGRRSLMAGQPAFLNSTAEQDYVPNLRELGYDFLPGACIMMAT
jgi:hypothetical protein